MFHRSFRLSRRRLAFYYTVVMSFILSLSGIVVYKLIVHARWLNLDAEMKLVAAVLEDAIEPSLQRPGQLDAAAEQHLPGLCREVSQCQTQSIEALSKVFQGRRSLLYQVQSGNYCARFKNRQGEQVAVLLLPANTPQPCNHPDFWKTRTDSQGQYYHQAYYPLYTVDRQLWGSLQIVRSLNPLDSYLFRVEIVLLILILTGIAGVGISSWWLAGIALRPAQHSYEQMQQFTADAAHELRTPLAALRAMVQTGLRSSDLSVEEAREVLQVAERQSQRLTVLVQDLLLLGQLDQQGTGGASADCHLNRLLEQLVEEFTAMAQTANLRLGLELQTTKLLSIAADENQLYRALANLLSNAIQYTPAGGQILLSLSQVASVAVIRVQDTGVGIPLEEQQRIFDRFYRVKRDRSRHTGGSGLGLAIVQEIVRYAGGSIEVESEPGSGSTFTVRLPIHYESDSHLMEHRDRSDLPASGIPLSQGD